MTKRSAVDPAANGSPVTQKDDAPRPTSAGSSSSSATETPLRSPIHATQSGVHHGADGATDIDGDQGMMPSTTASTTQVVGEVAEGLKAAVVEACKWVDKKADDLSKEGEGGVGPYATPATCVVSDLDPLACGIMPAMEAEGAKAKHETEELKDQVEAEKK